MNAAIRNLINNEIEQEHIPGAVLFISYQGNVISQEAFGYRSVFPVKREMNIETLFDLASLTKLVATLPMVLKLIENGTILLRDKVSNYIPEFAQNNKEDVTIYHLLTHTSGLTAHRQFYQDNLTTAQIFDKICRENLEAPMGKKVIYSDLGFILLYKLIEIVTKQPFETVVENEVFKPLGMDHTCFRPSFQENIASTEFSQKLKKYKNGIVHDDNAECMGGVSGHAGLFSTVKDLSKFASMMENEGICEQNRFLSSSIIKLTRMNYTPFASDYRGLGWQLQNPLSASCGELFSNNSYGHTGFTGTSIWFDPEIKLHVILLTNRVHFGRKNWIIRFRPVLHNLIRSQF